MKQNRSLAEGTPWVKTGTTDCSGNKRGIGRKSLRIRPGRLYEGSVVRVIYDCSFFHTIYGTNIMARLTLARTCREPTPGRPPR